MRELAGRRTLVLGLGRSGRSAANFCAARGAQVTAADERTLDAIGAEALSELSADVAMSLGAPFPDPARFDLVVPSPGVPAERYRERAQQVWGDIELAYRALQVPIVAITGTNGKSTTTLLCEAMLRAAGLRARAAGNLGAPALGLVGEALDIAVLEVSSFQLETVDAFRPHVAVVLNISADHLDRHGSLDAYVAAKARILARQEPEDFAVLNFDDPRVRALAGQTRARVLPFSSSVPVAQGAWLDMGAALLAWHATPPTRVPLGAPRLAGVHNRENALAALVAAVAAGAEPQRAASALASFTGLRHRAEVVGCADKVCFVNDSKATNPGAAIRSLEGFERPVVWIAGGRDKGLDFGELAAVAVRRSRAIVLIGEAADKLERALAAVSGGQRCALERADSLEQAVARAAALAQPGDVVLLAPACASQDQFRDFEERGERFCGAARAHIERAAGARSPLGAAP